jgi:hypothetical protein
MERHSESAIVSGRNIKLSSNLEIFGTTTVFSMFFRYIYYKPLFLPWLFFTLKRCFLTVASKIAESQSLEVRLRD